MQSVLPDVSARDAQAAQSRYVRRDLRPAGRGSRAIGRAHDADRTGRAVHGSEDLRAHRILRRHNISTLLSTNGTLLDEASAEKLLATPLEHITLSFDGSTKESFEFYRKGAKFEKVRDNFVRFARMKHERKRKVQIVVQMVRMEKNWDEVDDFLRFWSAVAGCGPGSHQRRRDEPDASRPRARGGGLEASLPLSLARSDVREAQRRRVSVLPELHA